MRKIKTSALVTFINLSQNVWIIFNQTYQKFKDLVMLSCLCHFFARAPKIRVTLFYLHTLGAFQNHNTSSAYMK